MTRPGSRRTTNVVRPNRPMIHRTIAGGKREEWPSEEGDAGTGNRMKQEGEGCSVDDGERDDRAGKSEWRGEPQQGKSLGYHRL